MPFTVVADCAEIEQALRSPSASVTDLIVGYLEERGRAESALASKHTHHLELYRVARPYVHLIGLSDDRFSNVARAIEKGFPNTAREFFGSPSSMILSSFAPLLWEIARDLNPGKGASSGKLQSYLNIVVSAPPALAEIAKVSAKRVSGLSEKSVTPYDFRRDPLFQSWSEADLAFRPFVNLGMRRPSTKEDLQNVESAILQNQLEILRVGMRSMIEPINGKLLSELLQGPSNACIQARTREAVCSGGSWTRCWP